MKKNFIIILIFVNVLFSQTNTITYYEFMLPDLLDPVYGGKFGIGQRVCSLLFRNLYGYDKNRQFVPILAEKKPVAESSENMVFIIYLKDNLYWHDGEPITARDVVKSFKLLTNPNTDYSAKNMLSIFSSIESQNKTSLRVTLNQPVDSPEYYLVFPIFPSHLITTPSLQRSSNYTREPKGSGPYSIANITDTDILFDLFEKYNASNRVIDKNTQIEKILLEEKTDASLWVNDLLSNSVDILVNVPLTRVSDLENSNASFKEYPNYSIDLLGFNMRRTSSLLTYKFIRKAICMGFDRQSQINSFYSTLAHCVTGPYPFGTFYYWNAVAEIEYNKEEARKILENAGCVKQNGIYYLDGKKLSFGIIYTRGGMKDRITTNFQEAMRDIGIEILNPQGLENEQYLNYLKQGKFDIAWTTPIYSEDFNIESMFKSDGGANFWGYQNTRVDHFFNKLNETDDPQVKLGYGHNLHKIICEDVPCFFLWSKNKYAGFSSRINYIDPHPVKFFQTVEEWKVNNY